MRRTEVVTGGIRFLKVVTVIGVMFLLAGCEIPQAKVLKVDINGDAVSDPESILDFGYEVGAFVENVGAETARFTVQATLSCTEGQWIMERDVLLDGHEQQTVKFFFKQPTVEAKDIKYIVTIS